MGVFGHTSETRHLVLQAGDVDPQLGPHDLDRDRLPGLNLGSLPHFTETAGPQSFAQLIAGQLGARRIGDWRGQRRVMIDGAVVGRLRGRHAAVFCTAA